MESSARELRHHLEPVESERLAGAWRISGCMDLVSERRYLVSRAALDAAARLDADVLSFRCETAAALAPGTCLPVLQVATDGGRVELLTHYARVLEPGPLGDAAVERVIAALFDTLRRFESHAFFAGDVAFELLGTDGEERLVVLPGAYALPPGVDAWPRGDMDAARERGRAAHLGGLGAIASGLSALHGGRFGPALRALADAITARTVATLDEAEAAFRDEGRAAVQQRRTRRSRRDATDAPGFDVGAVLHAIGEHQAIEVTGPAGSGRTRALGVVFERLREAGKDVHWVDEWDAAQTVRKKSASREACPLAAVWIADDADEKPLLHALLLEHVVELDKRAGLVIATRSDAADLAAFPALVRSRSPRGVCSVALPAPERDATPPVIERLDGLDEDARQILELVSIACAPLPADAVLSVLPGADGGVYARIHGLASAQLLAIDYRRLPPSGNVSVTLRVPSESLRRAVYEQIPDARRRNLHRTIARIAEGRGLFPPVFVYEHLVRGGEGEAAAARAAAFLKNSTRAQRMPFLNALIRDLVDGGLYKTLPYGDQLSLLVRLGDDLLARGRQADAESLLTRAKSLPATSEDIRSNAPVVSEAVRLLGDAWAARGQLRQALGLLEDAKDEVGPYLKLADQARLLNEIGWLQYRLGDYSSCVDSCKFTLNTLNANEHPLVVAQALNLMGVISFNTSRYDEAISYYEQGAFLRERENDQNALAASCNNLALAYQAKSEYDKALGYLHRSIDIKKRQNNEAGLAGGYLNLALLYLEVHNFDEAEKRCRESLQISSELGLAQLIADNHNTLGDIVFARGRLDDAETFYLRALEHARRLATINEEMGAHKRLAKLYLRKNRLDDAHRAIEEAARLARQVGSKYENAQTEDLLGELMAAQENRAEAVDHFEKAATLYATLSKHRHVAASLAKAGLSHARGGNALVAKHFLDRAQDLIKSQIGHEIPEEIVTLQQTLRENPLRPSVAPSESQKLLYVFHELSSLSDYADDKCAFSRRIIDVFRDLTGALHCTLVLQTEDERFISMSASGDQEPVEDPALRSLVARALQLGAVLHAESPEAEDLVGQVVPEREARDGRLVVVPMKSMGKDLGCVVLFVPPSALPRSKEDLNFLSCIGRHVAGDLRLSLHLDERAHKEETLAELRGLSDPALDRYHYQTLVGRDPAMRKVFRTLDKIKDMDTGILIIGESGTGKTELARIIHHNSRRRKDVFQSIHCAEIPTSLLESELFGHERGAFTGAVQRKLGRCEIADGGTVFLDDVNVMPLETQSKLLHYLESKSFMRLGGTQKISTDVRIIAASNEDLERLVKEGRFREDLYYRMKVIQIELPPLHERPDDMILIAQEFLKRRCQAQGKRLKTLSSETIKLFQKYRWPGNVRELQNVLEQIVLLCDDDIVEPSSLPEDFLKRAAGGGKLRWQSLEQLAQQMIESGGYSESNPLMPQVESMLASKMAAHVEGKARAAGLLGITKPTLYARLREYDRLK